MSVGNFSKILSKRETVSFFFTKKKKNEKEVLSNGRRYHAKPDEAPRTAFIGSLLESISRPSFRFAKVR